MWGNVHYTKHIKPTGKYWERVKFGLSANSIKMGADKKGRCLTKIWQTILYNIDYIINEWNVSNINLS